MELLQFYCSAWSSRGPRKVEKLQKFLRSQPTTNAAHLAEKSPTGRIEFVAFTSGVPQVPSDRPRPRKNPFPKESGQTFSVQTSVTGLGLAAHIDQNTVLRCCRSFHTSRLCRYQRLASRQDCCQLCNYFLTGFRSAASARSHWARCWATT
jgi:hypothetical protein